jgi:hypothetical protein
MSVHDRERELEQGHGHGQGQMDRDTDIGRDPFLKTTVSSPVCDIKANTKDKVKIEESEIGHGGID